MFDPQKLSAILRQHRETLEQLARLERHLKHRFFELDPAIDALILALASGESVLLIGPPGTAKSKLVRAFCEGLGLIDETRTHVKPGAEIVGNEAYFEYLLTQFTEPSELFGFYDLTQLEKQGLIRLDDRSLQKARVAFLDEVFNASSAILNSLLSVMHEGILHDREKRIRVDLECLVGATNDIPQSSELLAFFDRFLLRVEVDNLRVDKRRYPQYQKRLAQLIDRGWRESQRRGTPKVSANPPQPVTGQDATPEELFTELRRFRHHLGTLRPTGRGHDRLAYLIEGVRSKYLSEMSNRRLIKMCFVMTVHRLYRAARDGEPDGSPLTFDDELEFGLMLKYFLDRRDAVAEDQMLEKLRSSPR